MKEKLKNKKVVYSIIGLIALVLVTIGITYAYWLVTKTQEGENVISSGCLDISLSNEANDISLTNQFPLSDEEGINLTPYTFTVTNNCNTSVDYQIALEAIGDESTALSSNALKVALNDEAKLFSSYKEVDTTVSGAYEARKLGTGTLASKGSEGASDSYSLRIWIDENADISEINKIFTSKISVTIGQGIKNIVNPYEEGTIAHNIIDNYGGTNNIEELDASTGAFETDTTASDANVYKTQDDLGDSYYFRGAPTNNYVEFGTYAEDTTLTVYDFTNQTEKTVEVKAGSPMYWRIVRINGDGSIRLIYDGIELVANGVAHRATIGVTAYNTNYNDAKYVGYTYDVDGVDTNSTIKGVVDAWYDKHLKTTYGTHIADEIFCNDRSGVRTDDYGTTYYAPYDRLSNNKKPVLTCTNKEDRYTTSTDIGNGKLTDAEGNARPIGLLTADEVFMAGGTTASNNSYYLYSGEIYWTSTPHYIDGGMASVRIVDNVLGAFNNIYVNEGSLSVRPVINLKADTLIEGKGTIDSPYKIVME